MRGGIATWLAAFVALGPAAVAAAQAAGRATAPAATRPAAASGVQRIASGTLVRVEGKNLIVKPRPARGELEESAEIVVPLADDTRLTFEGMPAGLDELPPGAFVDVTRFPERPNRPAYLLVSATYASYAATVVRVEGRSVIVRVGRRFADPEERTVATDDRTRIVLASGRESTLADLKPEAAILIADDGDTARRIRVRPPQWAAATRPADAAGPRSVRGELLRVEGRNLIASPGFRDDAPAVTIPTDEATRLTVDYEPGRLADLRPAMRITALRLPDGAAGGPRFSIVATSPGRSGTVVRIDGQDLVLRVGEPGALEAAEAVIPVDDQVRVIFTTRTVGGPLAAPARPTLADLKPGLYVHLFPASGAAKKIVVLAAE